MINPLSQAGKIKIIPLWKSLIELTNSKAPNEYLY